MRAVTATRTALTPSASTLPAIIVRSRIDDRRYVDMHRQPRTWIIWQHGHVATPLIVVRHAIPTHAILERVDRAAASYFALVGLVAIATRPEAVTHDRPDDGSGRRRCYASVATPDLSTEQTAGNATYDGSGERIAAMILALGYNFRIAFLARNTHALILRCYLRHACIVIEAGRGEGDRCGHRHRYGCSRCRLAHVALLGGFRFGSINRLRSVDAAT